MRRWRALLERGSSLCTSLPSSCSGRRARYHLPRESDATMFSGSSAADGSSYWAMSAPSESSNTPNEECARRRQEMLRILSRCRAPACAMLPLPACERVDDAGETLLVQQMTVETEVDEYCPVVLVRLERYHGEPLRPIFVLHGTGKSKDEMLKGGHLARIAKMGLLAVGVDTRHHGARQGETYWGALVSAWRQRRLRPELMDTLEEYLYERFRRKRSRPRYNHPFMYDSVWDLMRLLDWLETRSDVDSSRVGVTGISLGGMHSWLWASVDERVSACCPLIGVQSFSYAIEHDCWHARASSLQPLFEAAAADMGRPLDAKVVRAVWDAILPGLLTLFDAHRSLCCIAPRPCLIINSAADPRCPRAGVEQAIRATRDKGCGANLGLLLDITAGEEPLPAEDWAAGHIVTPAMAAAADAFMRHTILQANDSLPAIKTTNTLIASDAE